MTRFEIVMAVVAVLGRRYHVIGLSRDKVILRYVVDQPFDAERERTITIPGFHLRIEPNGRGVARRL